MDCVSPGSAAVAAAAAGTAGTAGTAGCFRLFFVVNDGKGAAGCCRLFGTVMDGKAPVASRPSHKLLCIGHMHQFGKSQRLRRFMSCRLSVCLVSATVASCFRIHVSATCIASVCLFF
jgi:hypothetical protein